MRAEYLKWWIVLTMLLMTAGCESIGPMIGRNETVHTPIYQDNRVYFLKSIAGEKDKQSLASLSDTAPRDPDIITRNSPLSIILRSVEIPSAESSTIGEKSVKSPVRKPADYAVVLDVGAASNGELQSIVVWYQRGVYPDQSLNFSNLLVYFEPRWDERVAPLFRIRIIDVTKERNEETRRMLESAHNLASAGAALSGNPAVAPGVGMAFSAANMVLANKQNRALVDYSVQLYSSSAAAAAGGSKLGVLKRGSYIVLGKPSSETREFWGRDYTYDAESRILSNATSKVRVNVPTALISVGTFDSIVPKVVMERSAALTSLLAQNGKDSTIENIESSADRLAASVKAFALAEKLTRYGNSKDVEMILQELQKEGLRKFLSEDDKFNLMAAISRCYGQPNTFTEDEAKAFYTSNKDKKCYSN